MQLSQTRSGFARRGLWLIVLSALLWGTVGVTTQSIYHVSTTNALSVGFFRLAFATPALALACWAKVGTRLFRIQRRDFVLTLLIGVMLALYQVCYFTAIRYSGVAVAALVTLCTAPVLVALLSLALLRERLTLAVSLALACAVAGTALLINLQPGQGQQAATDTLLGIGFALGSATGYAVVALCGRRLAGRCHPLQVNLIGFATGALLLLPLALLSGFSLDYPPTSWLLLLYLGLVPTALAYVLFLTGIQTTTATVASIITLLEPLTATLLAWLLFGERLGPLGVLGGLLMMAALGVLVQGSPSQVVEGG